MKMWRIGAMAVIGLAASLPLAAQDVAGDKKPAAVEKPVKLLVHLRLSGSLRESPSELASLFGSGNQRTLNSFLQRLETARKDESVAAVVLTIDRPMLGWGQVQELRAAIIRTKADKPVHAFLQEGELLPYLVASSASRVSLLPAGELWLLGLHARTMYFKGLLDKLGLAADMEHFGPYKSAVEQFTRAEPSEAAIEQQERILESLYQQMIEMIVSSRGMGRDEVIKIIDGGMMTAERGLELKLVDAVSYRREFLDQVLAEYGEDAKYAANYGKEKEAQVDLSGPMGMMTLFSKLFSTKPKSTKPKIAVVNIDGSIGMGESQDWFFVKMVGSSTIRKALEAAGKDDLVKAVVLRVDSPGGSSVASDIMWHAIKSVADHKPVVTSMGNVAASGGYYVACGTKRIFANPGTITGSIGVFGGKLITEPMWNKVGLTFHEYKRGAHADIMNTNRPFDEDERKLMRELMGSVYSQFKDRVVDARGDRLSGDIESLAGGRVYTGQQAMAKGLIDEFGGLADAIRYAAKEAGVEDYDVELLPAPKSLFDLIQDAVGGGSDDDEVSVDTHLTRLIGGGILKETFQTLRQTDPQALDAMLRGLILIQAMKQEAVMTAMPGELIIR